MRCASPHPLRTLLCLWLTTGLPHAFILASHVDAGRALEFQKDIDDYVGRNRDLRSLELAEDEWAAIAQVAGWLKAFRSATTQMSASKQPMLSTTLAIFRGLQEHIRLIFRELPASTPPKIKVGLLNAHKKLSDYYYKYDQSPFYTWAARTFPPSFTCMRMSHNSLFSP